MFCRSSRSTDREERRKILRIALPAIVSNVTVPLLGLADTAIVGHLGKPAYIGAIAVGTMIFSVIYWLFGFLRAGTSGFASQAYGAGRTADVVTALVRSSLFALTIAVLLLVLQRPIAWIAFRMAGATPEVEASARTYYYICIWGAPAVIMQYGIAGWLIGLQQTRVTMTVAIVQNVANVVLSLLLVFACRMQVAGVALGTLAAQYAGLALALWYIGRMSRKFGFTADFHTSLHTLRTDTGAYVRRLFGKESRFFSVNRDIFFRTLCILSVTTFFTMAGARQGDLLLAANALLLQLFYLFSYFMDGFSNAGEALAGEYYGRRDGVRLKRMIRVLFGIGAMLAVAFTLLYGALTPLYLRLMTDSTDVAATAAAYVPWTAAVPVVSFMAFLWDGIFVGLTRTRPMFLTMLFSALVFFAVYLLASPAWGNHALWLAFCLFLLLRGVTLGMSFR
jgi:MATE family multidrug resistance protein